MFAKRFFSSDAFLHSFKTALACILGIGICAFFHIYNSLWLVITILVVMGSKTHFGGALQQSYVRVLGTFGGAAIACVAIVFFPANPYIMTAVIFGSVMLFSYLADSNVRLKDVGVLGAITTVTILITQNSTLDYALVRVIQIVGGIIIALLVSKFVFPIHARIYLLKNFADILRHFIEIYSIMYAEKKTKEKQIRLRKLEKEIVNLLAEQPGIISDSKKEMSSIPFNKPIAESILSYQHRLFRSITFLYDTLNRDRKKFKILINIPELDKFNENVIYVLTNLAGKLEDKCPLPSLNNLDAALIELEKALVDTHDSEKNDLIAHLYTLRFCCHYMVDEITVLQTMIGTYRSM